MFEKNLQYIDNEALKRRLRQVTDVGSKQGISYCVTPSKDYILLKNDLPMDDLTNPREAIVKHLNTNIKSEMKSNDIIVIFGIGLGYILDEVFNRYPSRIFLYEPDLELLKFVLSNVDISEHLSSGRIYISNDLNELVEKLESSYITKDKVEVVYLQNYGIVKNQDLLLLTQKVYDACKSKMVDINTITKFSKRWLKNSLNNIAAINSSNAYLLSDLEKKFIGQTALIAGAGPSLNDNIEYIQSNRNKFVIFAVNKAVKYLQKNGITPDFVVALDAGNMLKTLDVSEDYISRANCIMDMRTDRTIFEKPFRKIFVNFSGSDFLTKKLSKYNSFMKFCEGGGSASTLALVSAVRLGFSQIVFAGIDLAFKDNVIYTDGQTIERTALDEMVVDSVKKKIVQVKSVNGGFVSTREDYQSFVHHFETIIKELNFSNIYNVSSFGAYIEGVKNCTFNEIDLQVPAIMAGVDTVEPFKFEIKEFMQDEFYNINNIISLLSKGAFSPALVSAIVKSALIYQYMQAEILTVLQKNFEEQVADEFIEKTKDAIKNVVEVLQKNKLI